MFFPGSGMLTELATSAAIATLPAPLSKLVKDMRELKNESRELSNRLMDPIHGLVLPFCIKNSDRIFFCADITRDIVLIAAGGSGFGTLAETIVSQPSMIFQFMTEAIIPEIEAMAKEGKTMYLENLNYAFTLLLGLTLEKLKTMSVDDFVNHIISVMKEPKPDPSLMPQRKQLGGTDLRSLKVYQLKAICREYGLKCSGKKDQLINRIRLIN